jgi:two-component system NarL family response regulator
MGSEERAIRIMLVDVQSLFRHAMVGVLGDEHGLEVVAEADDAFGAVMTAERTLPDLVLLDADPLDEDLTSLIERMRDSAPDCRILILANDDQLGTLADALRAGASGYLTKDVSIAELVQAAKSVNRGEVVIPPRMVGGLLAMLVSQRPQRGEGNDRLARLTRREREVLALLAEGADKDAISRTLVISPETARTHVQNILAKLGLHSRLEAAAFGRRHRVVRELADLRG